LVFSILIDVITGQNPKLDKLPALFAQASELSAKAVAQAEKKIELRQ
jgi:hypothetical protein